MQSYLTNKFKQCKRTFLHIEKLESMIQMNKKICLFYIHDFLLIFNQIKTSITSIETAACSEMSLLSLGYTYNYIDSYDCITNKSIKKG